MILHPTYLRRYITEVSVEARGYSVSEEMLRVSPEMLGMSEDEQKRIQEVYQNQRFRWPLINCNNIERILYKKNSLF